MTKYITKATKTLYVLLLSLSFACVSTAMADDHDGVHKGDKKKVMHHPSDGHKHKKKRKKSKKIQHKNHKHKAGSQEDEEHHEDDHHDDNDSHNHSKHKHKKKSKKKKGEKKHKGHKHKQEHQDDDDHDHQHDGGDNHSDHSDGEKEHEGHAGHRDHDDHGEHDEHGEESFGEGKAITEVKNEGESFKLALEAQSLLGLGFGVIEKSVGRGVFMVPTKSLIFFNDEKGIFVKVGNWFKLVDVEMVKKGSNWSQVKSNDLSVGQKIVVAGTGLLRVAHLQASGQGGKGHAH